MSDGGSEQGTECQVCTKEIDPDDQQFVPCKCNYKVISCYTYKFTLHVHHYIVSFWFLFLEVVLLMYGMKSKAYGFII